MRWQAGKGKKERKGEGVRAAGAFCLSLCAGCVFGNCELGRTKQNTHENVPLLASSSPEIVFYEEEVILYLLFQASIAALP